MKTVLISGAGSGIGRAAAVELAKRGIRTVLLGRTEATLSETKSLLENSGEHEVVVADVRSKASIQEALGRVTAADVFAVIANAGVGGENSYGPDDRWEEVITTNLSGVYYLVQECLSKLRQSTEPYKHIIVMSSILARLGIPQYSAYCASKAGLLGLMRSWAVEYARDNILVNAICPGWVETRMAKEGIEKYAQAAGLNYEQALKAQMAQTALRKMSQPEEIAALIAYLVSDSQRSFTGQCFDINNGAYMPA